MQEAKCKTCMHSMEVGHRMRCNSEKFVYTGSGDEAPADGLGYWDSESYNGGFDVGPDFGCIHWQAKGL